MSLINLICPHCGGHFELDPDRPLQSFWVCPYCGNRSLMQKNNGLVRLRGIIPGRSTQADSETSTPGYEFRRDSSILTAKAEEPQSDTHPANPTFVDPLGHSIFTETNMPDRTPDNPDRTPENSRSLEAIIAEASADPKEVVMDSSAIPDIVATPQTTEPTAEPVTASESRSDDLFTFYRHLAEDAAENHDFPLFNTYSRQAIDCRPKDPRMYAIRAELIEEADGFARATWTSIGWFLLTPKRKLALIAQHLYNLNTALKYGKMGHQQELIRKIAWQLVRQAVDAYTEQGELRCQKRLLFKKFKGRYSRSDLKMNKHFIEALSLINSKTCPIGHESLREAIRLELLNAPPRIARRFKRF